MNIVKSKDNVEFMVGTGDALRGLNDINPRMYSNLNAVWFKISDWNTISWSTSEMADILGIITKEWVKSKERSIRNTALFIQSHNITDIFVTLCARPRN